MNSWSAALARWQNLCGISLTPGRIQNAELRQLLNISATVKPAERQLLLNLTRAPPWGAPELLSYAVPTSQRPRARRSNYSSILQLL
jgi:hypothetical protein